MTSNDVVYFVELALGNKITVPQAQVFFERLSPQQKTTIDQILDKKAQKNPTYCKSSTENIAWTGYLWQQHIENAWPEPNPPGLTYPSSYTTTSLTCDQDPDTD